MVGGAQERGIEACGVGGEAEGDFGLCDAERLLVDQEAAAFGEGQGSPLGEALGLAQTLQALRREVEIEYDAAGDGVHGRKATQDEAIPGEQEVGFVEGQANEGRGAGGKRFFAREKAEFGFAFHGGGVEVEWCAVLEGLGR